MEGSQRNKGEGWDGCMRARQALARVGPKKNSAVQPVFPLVFNGPAAAGAPHSNRCVQIGESCLELKQSTDRTGRISADRVLPLHQENS